MPLAPRLAWTRDVGRGARVPLEVADRHRRRDDQRARRRAARPAPRGRPPARRPVVLASSSRVDGVVARRCVDRRATASSHADRASASRATISAAGATMRRWRGGRDRRHVGRQHECARRCAASHSLTTRDAGAGRPARSTSGTSAVGRRRVAQEGVGMASRRSDRSSPLRASASTGQPAGRASDGSASVRPATISTRACRAPTRRGARLRRGRRHGRSTAAPSGRASGSGARAADQRLAERKVEVHRARRRTERSSATAREPASATCARVASSATPGSTNQRTAPTVEVRLVDRLRRPDIAQLGRAVGGARDAAGPHQVRPRRRPRAGASRRCRWW